MKSESKTLLTAQTEKPNHYSYLKEFRVEQCPLFLQHKCTQHRPFTCFHWHFMNQRRRRPVRKRDGSFNYSADNYCTKFDETTGLCPEGDECPFLHRTAGDTERRYHLRYYKTCMCVHDTDTRGFCVKNGPHCAFAHGNHDLRPPVYDIKELQALENPDADPNSVSNGPNVLDKERNLMNEDPKWQDTGYVLANYKTELCKRPPRLCRQGYACPQYHNSRDKRRSPRKFKYRSTPCPNVKHGDEWGEPNNCDSGDQCAYCHTRTEQQFHPEIYKSTKCNDIQTSGYCPRGVFCAFAHVEQEMNLARDLAARVDSGMNLADILSSALPSEKRETNCQDSKREEKSSDSSNGSGEVSESASTSSLGSNSSHSKAPGSQLTHHHKNNSLHSSAFGGLGNNHQDELHASIIRKQIMEIDSDPVLNPLQKAQKKQTIYLNSVSLASSVSPLAMPFYPTSDTVESVVGNALDDLTLDEPLNIAASLDKDLEVDSPTVSNSISAGLASSGLLGSSAPVNIPGSALNERNVLGNFSPSTSSPLQLQSSFLSSRFSHQDSLDSTFLNPPHMQLSNSATKISSFTSPGSLFDFSSHQNMSPSSRVNHNSSSLLNSFPLSSSSIGTNITNEMQRICEELASSRSKLASWDERIAQARSACEAWQRESEESNRKANIAEQQRDEAISQAKALQKEVDLLQGSPYLHGLRRVSELKTLSLPTLKSLESQLKNDLEEIQKVIYLQTATKCMVCEEGIRSVTLNPCNHFVLCSKCVNTQKECPYCQTPIT